MSMTNYSDTTAKRTRDLLTCSAVTQPTASPSAPPIQIFTQITAETTFTKLVQVVYILVNP